MENEKSNYYSNDFFTGCVMNSINFAQLVNNTGDDIKVSVYYNKALLDSLGLSSHKRFLELRSERGQSFLISINIDSFAVTYIVPKRETLIFDQESGPVPDFTSMKYIVVQSAGRVSKYGPSEISQIVKVKEAGFGSGKCNRLFSLPKRLSLEDSLSNGII